MKKLTILIVGIVLVATFVLAQVVTFPPSFRMSLNSLPTKQSADQIIFNCPYDEVIEHRETDVISYNETSRMVIAEVKYWTLSRKCAGSMRLNFTIAQSSSQGQLVTNFINGANNQFLAEAQRNNRRIQNKIIIAKGGN